MAHLNSVNTAATSRSLPARFTEHPASVGETYGEHMQSALSFAGSLAMASLCCAIHAICPWLCERSGSTRVQALYQRMVTHRTRTQRAMLMSGESASD